jgi:hypothetical protein
MEINKYILHKALLAGICKEWAVQISQACDVQDLLKMYVAGIDFCLKNNFPSNTDLLRLGGVELGKHGIYLDTEVEIYDKPFVVLLGASSGEITIGGYSVSEIFIKDQSSANVQVTGNAFVIIDCFDSTNLSITASDNCKLLINVYGCAAVTHTSQDKATVKIVNKNKATY